MDMALVTSTWGLHPVASPLKRSSVWPQLFPTDPSEASLLFRTVSCFLSSLDYAHVHEPVAHVFLLAGSLECFSLPPLRWFIYPTYLCAQAQHSPECFPLGPSARTELARWIITECMCMSCCSHLTLNARCAEAVLCISLQLVGAVTNWTT